MYVVPWPAGSRRVVTRARDRRRRTSTSTSASTTATACTARPPTRAASATARCCTAARSTARSSSRSAQTLAKDQKLPVENVSDPYTLTVTEEAAAGETEPNNNEADANPLELTQELRGYLDTRDDVDVLRWTGADGTYNVIVRADGLPLDVAHQATASCARPAPRSVELQRAS